MVARSARSSLFVLSAAPYRARNMTSVGLGSGFCRKCSRTTRLMRFLWVARRTFFFATINPNLEFVWVEGVVKSIPDAPPTFRGFPLKTALKACLSRSLCFFWNDSVMGMQAHCNYAERRARPRERRRANTLRPFFVAMRARKPWLRLRLRTLG